MTTLCLDCQAAERSFHPVYHHNRPCCLARAIVDEPTRDRRRLFAAKVRNVVTADEWREIRARIDELLKVAA